MSFAVDEMFISVEGACVPAVTQPCSMVASQSPQKDAYVHVAGLQASAFHLPGEFT